MSIDTARPVAEPETLVPDGELSGQSAPELPIITAESNNPRLYRYAGRLAVGMLALGAYLAPNIQAVEATPDLVTRNIEAALNRTPQLDFHNYTADEAVAQTYQAFHLRGGFYIEELDRPSSFASTWTLYNVLSMLDIAKTLDKNPSLDYESQINQLLASLNTYWSGAPIGYPAGYDATQTLGFGQPDRYVDDNLWMGQAFMKRAQTTNSETDFNRVKQIMDLFISQRGPDGGTYWKVQLPHEANRGRVLVSNATAIPTLVDMYLSGHGDDDYIATAEQTFAWIQQLYDPSTGLYFDNFTADDQVNKFDTTIYTYNQAEVLNSMLALNKVDPEHYPLYTAIDFAQTTMDYFSSHNTYGISKFDVIYLKSIMNLASTINDSAFTADVRTAISLAKNAITNSPSDLIDAAASAAVIGLSEMPFDKWPEL